MGGQFMNLYPLFTIALALSLDAFGVALCIGLNNKTKLAELAKIVCRDLKKNSTKAERIFWEAVLNRNFLGKKF